MCRGLRNIRNSQKCTEVSEMYQSLRTLLYIKVFFTSKQFQKFGKSERERDDDVLQ